MGKGLWTSEHHIMWFIPQTIAKKLDAHDSLECLCMM